MDQLHRSADKLETDIRHLQHVLHDDMKPEEIDLALSIIKRVRRESTILVRHFAALRDNATA